jgi:hypothetical protein
VTFPYFISLPIKTLSSGFIAIFSFKCTCFEGDRRQEKMNILYDKCWFIVGIPVILWHRPWCGSSKHTN